MPGNYAINNRVAGELITAVKYLADHQVHVDNFEPAKMDDGSNTVAAMQVQTNPGEQGSESQATTLTGELERLRFAIAEAKGRTYWYETADGDLALLAWGVI